MNTWGYMRVSSKAQGSKYGLERQKKILLENNVTDTFLIADEISGVKKSRKGLDYLLDNVQAGDIVKCVSMDRLGRDCIDCLTLIETFRNKNVGVHFIQEGIDTSRNDAMTNAFIAICSAFAQMERERMLERIEQTKAAMKEKGLSLGRPRVNEDKLQTAVNLYKEGKGSYRAISKIVGISPAKICRAVNNKG